MTAPRLPLPTDTATESEEPTAPVDPWRAPTTLEEPERADLGTLKDYFRRMQERGLLD